MKSPIFDLWITPNWGSSSLDPIQKHRTTWMVNSIYDVNRLRYTIGIPLLERKRRENIYEN